MTRFDYRMEKHPETGWQLVRLMSFGGDDAHALSELAFTPEIGSNLISFAVGGTEYLCDHRPTEHGHAILGTPILYPTPDRMRKATFTFDGRVFTFEPNAGAEFIHGLVREAPWRFGMPVVTADEISVSTWVAFEPGKPYYERFPIRNRLELTYTLRANGMRFGFAVHNEDPGQRLPFGLGIHPYFRIIGPRESVRIQVPATKWQEVTRTDLLPTGRLLDIEDGPADLRAPTSLGGLDMDDVFWGMCPAAPQVIYYDQIGAKITLKASELFTHSAVYTPLGRPFFCVENQSCSTDAHNLYAQGGREAAHLVILDPGQSLAAWVEFEVSDQ